MRSIWTGSIAFGLVNIPVKLFSAIDEKGLDLDMLDKKDLGHIKYKRVNENTGKEVLWENIVKGFEVDGKYIVLTDQDFEKASPEKTKLINLELFTKTEQIDVILFDRAYYVAPAKGGERAFELLEEALKKTAMAGVGTFVLRNKEKPVILRSAHNVLLLHTLRFIHEIRDPSEFVTKKATTNKKELEMATGLIKTLEGDFNINQFKDTYTEQLLKLIKAKASGKKLPAAPKVLEKPSTDLVAQLQKSLALHNDGNSGKKSAKTKTAARKPATKKAKQVSKTKKK
ncbi:non-homologous end joining protein Ku [Arachidicoccus terrestris]|uniref:non-homologous end joining protein Ku n=1 Tax=Arachidicoccus terrestris TaxID=2875539 RepID=UPI001CC41AB0|nr:Ku protein [Arachidicoccus terrestris]UAY55904.1 Ku protein [Arachidicoccus terrestris]